MPLSALDVLVRLYVHHLPPSTATARPFIPIKTEPEFSSSPPEKRRVETHRERDPVDVSFLRGHLAVLFGLLMQGNPVNQVCILDALGTASIGKDERTENGSRFELERLIERAREFAMFYAALNVGGRSGHGDEEIEKEEMRESQVARDIVLFLENLRDEV
jgi:hypothetical protein